MPVRTFRQHSWPVDQCCSVGAYGVRAAILATPPTNRFCRNSNSSDQQNTVRTVTADHVTGPRIRATDQVAISRIDLNADLVADGGSG